MVLPPIAGVRNEWYSGFRMGIEAGKQETQENRIGSGERIEKGLRLGQGEDAVGGAAGAVQKASRLIAEGHAVRQAHFRHPFGEIRINWAN
jgi:hypothetical protein